MGDQKGAGILWTDYTHNPWHGCVKVSQGCKFCYADAQDKRFGESHWGPSAPRKMLSAANWRKPLLWNGEAAAAGVRARVFCASMADVFEKLPADHPSAGDVEDARARLWELVEATPSLDWLLLTKRPKNIRLMSPPSWWGQGFPENVWVGTSVEDQATADDRIPHLLKVPARVRFLSCEPLLGPVDLCDYLTPTGYLDRYTPEPGIEWVICGGESGPHARPMHPDWARGLRDQCQAAGVSYFFKQWGNWQPAVMSDKGYLAAKGQVWDWRDGWMSVNVGKHVAGRLLDGQTWSEFPAGERFRA